ncbi:hypothetical protein RI129_009230 [Pyrocoelia pectoralis]|uniref:Ribosome biogenesis regulatory protein n=1 Tax=Pyrocoelia pectoralis TaxID=417401 RepID=A0AAN7V811_9COLE
MDSFISTILDNSLKEANNSITVDKHLQLEYDVGTLLAVDSNNLNLKTLMDNENEYLLKLSRDNVQLLFNEIWKLPTDRIDESIVAKLPQSNYIVPRSRALPKPKPLTKWEQFAKLKGIKKNKKTKQSWDEQLNKWVPLYGYKRAQAEKEKDWVLEVPATSDPMEDQFLKKKTGKRENIAKNEFQRLRNVAKSRNIKVPRLGLTNPDLSSSKELQTAVTLTRSATASLGKFQNKLPKEKDVGLTKIMSDSNRKRKSIAFSSQEERRNNLNTINFVLNKKPTFNVEKAIGRRLKKHMTNPKSQSNKQLLNTKRKMSFHKKSKNKGKKKNEKQNRY